MFRHAVGRRLGLHVGLMREGAILGVIDDDAEPPCALARPVPLNPSAQAEPALASNRPEDDLEQTAPLGGGM